MIDRVLQDKIAGPQHKGKAIIIIGPRQVGKTTLIKTSLPFILLLRKNYKWL
jgi:hypothetical protein